MSARVERAVAVKKPGSREKVVKFVPEQLRAPFLLRCGALIIDYIVLVSIPVIGVLISRYMGNDGAKLFSSNSYNTGWLICGLVGLTNLVIFPVFGGKSLGKMLTGIRIVKSDGSSASLSRILTRHLIGYPLTILTVGLGFIFSAFNRTGRSLHDYLAGTTVIYGRRRVLKNDSNLQPEL
jgi:uncharacterized RDD family membrane protein YckC